MKTILTTHDIKVNEPFKYDGVIYKMVKSNTSLCNGCCFYDGQKENCADIIPFGIICRSNIIFKVVSVNDTVPSNNKHSNDDINIMEIN